MRLFLIYRYLFGFVYSSYSNEDNLINKGIINIGSLDILIKYIIISTRVDINIVKIVKIVNIVNIVAWERLTCYI